MSWRDYNKKKKNILEENDSRQNQQKFVPRQETSEEQTANRVKLTAQKILKQNQENVSTWDKVRNIANNISRDTSNIVNNFGLGVTSSAKNALYYIEDMSENKFGAYKRYNQTQSALKEKQNEIQNLKKDNKETPNISNIKLPTKEDTKRNIKTLTEEEVKQATLPKRQDSLLLRNIDESIAKDEEKIQKNVESSTNRVSKKLAELMPSIAQSVTGMGASVINPAIGLGFWQTSAGGGYTREAEKNGYTGNDAMLYGTIMGSMESATEWLGGELTKGVGKAFFKKGAVEGIKALGLDIAENFFEEAIMEPIQETVKQAIGKDGDWQDIGSRMLQSGINGALTSIIMGGASAGIGSATNLITKAQSGQEITQKEIADTLKEINKSEEVDIEKILANNFKFTAEDLAVNTDARTEQRLENVAEGMSRNEAQQLLIDNSDLDDTQKEVLSEIASQYNLSDEDVKKAIQNTKDGKYNNLEQIEGTTTQNNEVLNQEQQTIQDESKMAQNELSTQPNKYTQNLMKSIDNYNNSRQEGQEIFDINNEETRKEIESIQKVAEKRGINITFDESRFDNTNTNAFYEYDEKGNVANIVLNPNSTSKKYVQNLVIHEMTHSFEGSKQYDSLSKAILDYAKSKGEYKNAFDDLMNTYSKVYSGENLNKIVEKEAVANILGEKLGDKEFVDSLVNNQYVERSTIQKIIDFVKNQINRFKGYKDQEAYWNHVKTLFEDAYNKSTVSQEGLKNSVELNKLTDTRDSQGRQLSEGQVEYFKDSKVRDSEGNLKTMYHGTEANVGIPQEYWFSIFDEGRQGNNGSWFGNGFYFTENEEHAKEYAHSKGNVYEVYLDVKKPYIPYQNGNSMLSFQEDFKNNFEEARDIDGKLTGQQITDILKKNGYDGIIIGDNTVVFNSNQIKNTDNLNPTESNDIRYSKETSTTDSQGRTLSKQQQEYFKDSKVRDENGNLLEVYHGTPVKEDINVYDSSKAGSNVQADFTGIYFTDNIDFAEQFAHEQLEGSSAFRTKLGERGQLKKQYLNITNPLNLNELTDVSQIEKYIDEEKASEFSKEAMIETLKRAIANKNSQMIKFNLDLNKISQDYDGIIADLGGRNKGSNEYIVFNSNQIKNIDNTNPTNNPDIRYSVETEDLKADNQGNKINPNMQKFMEKSYAREDNSLNGKLKELYHGTNTGEFYTFDKNKASVEGDWGAGFYLTDNEGDVKANYEGGGPDFENKISKLAERIEQDEDISYEEAKEKAREQLEKGGYRITSYANIENPVIIGETKLFNSDDYMEDIESELSDEAENYQEEIEEYTKDYFGVEDLEELDEESIKEARDEYLRNEGIYDDIVNRYLEDDIDKAVYEVSNNLEMWGDTEEELRQILWDAVYNGGIDLQELKDQINEKLEITNENGDLANNEAVRIIAEALGYDGIIDNTVSDKFKNMGISKGTTHYIVFNSNQIKDINNQNPTTNPDIRYSQDTTGAWNNFIEKYFKNEGEGTAIKDLKKLPTREYTIQDYEEVINNSANIPEADKKSILKALEGIEFNKQSLNDFKQLVEDYDNTYKVVAQEQEQQRFENKNYKDEGRAELISTKRKEFNTNMDYDDSVVAELDEIIPRNRNGKRTVAQWKNMAKQLGQRIANLSPEQIEDIAVKSYYDLEPTKAITRYDNKSKTNVGYEQLYANDWVNEVFEGVRENRQFSMETENAKEIPNVEIKTKKERQIEKYNKYKKENIKANEQAINNLISFKNNTIRSLEDSINSKQALLDSKKNKNTKVANTLKMQIETLKTKQAELENLYNARIDKFNDKVSQKIEQETQKEMKKTAREVIQQELQPLIENSDKWVDKNKGILYNRETAQRNIEDIIKDKDSADYINETLFNPIQEHQANAIRGAKETFKKIEDLDLNKKKQYTYIEDENGKHIKMPTSTSTTYKVDEATLAQLYLEKKINETDLKEYNVDVNKIKKTATEFKNILDEYYEKMNETVVGYGYAPIGKIENYFPHFTENKPDTVLGKVAGLFGIDTTNNELPTEIAGKTEQFKPGKVWNSNILQRKGNKTDYDALKILDRYVRGAEDIINTTGDIQKLRQFERMLRYKYSEQGIQDRIDSIQESENFTPEEKEEAIHNLLLSRDNQLHHLGHLVTWLEDYTNVLANKKNSGDREFEKEFGRNMYKNMSAIEGRIAANTIGGNLSVSLTNFAPIFQAMGTTKVGNILTGMIQTTRNSLLSMANKNQTDFIENSDFLSNRFGADGIAEKTIGQKISGVLSTPMEAVDAFTAETIVRAKYRENLQNGMTEEEALKKADRYAARIMADRSKGALPVIFNNKNPASKLLTMFQVEPNNIVSNYLKDMPRNAKSKVQLTWQTAKLMGASWLFNTMAMAIRGGNEVLPDPIRLVSYLTKYFFGDDEEEKEQAEKDLQESLLSSIPFVQNVAGFLGFEDIGRVPISNAMPDLTKLGLITDKDVSSDYKKQELAKEFSKPLLYLGLPVGGAQLNKTIQGIATIKEGGSYKINKKGEKQLQFPVNNDPVSMIKATVFGKYSLPQAQQYIDSGFKSLNAKQTELYTNTDISFDDLSSYIDYSSSQELKDDKGNIQYTDDNGNLYWYDSKNGKVYSNDYKEISKSINELKKATKKENLVDYINKNMKDLSTDDKWELYKYNIISTTENDKGQSQLTRAESLIKNKLTTKEEYMKLLDGFIKEGINLPDQKTTDKLLENKINLETYYNYNLDLKKQKEINKQELKNNLPLSAEEQENKSKVTDKQKYKILQDNKYSNTDKKKIYETFVGTDDSTYNNLKLLNGDVSINAYLDYMQSDIKGKTKSGTKKNNIASYLQDSGLSNIEQAYIFGKKYSLNDNTNNYYNVLTSQLESIKGKLSEQELRDLYLSLYNVKELENGDLVWK